MTAALCRPQQTTLPALEHLLQKQQYPTAKIIDEPDQVSEYNPIRDYSHVTKKSVLVDRLLELQDNLLVLNDQLEREDAITDALEFYIGNNFTAEGDESDHTQQSSDGSLQPMGNRMKMSIEEEDYGEYYDEDLYGDEADAQQQYYDEDFYGDERDAQQCYNDEDFYGDEGDEEYYDDDDDDYYGNEVNESAIVVPF